MKFGKELASQMVQEWQDAYINYNFLKALLKDVLKTRLCNASSSLDRETSKVPIKRRLSLYRAFSGLTNRSGISPTKINEDEVILVSAEMEDDGSDGHYQTAFLRSSEEGGEVELVFFRRLDDELNKVVKFYKGKVSEVKKEAELLSKQMDALIALRIKVDNNSPLIHLVGGHQKGLPSDLSPNSAMPARKQDHQGMEVIQELELCSDEGDSRQENEQEKRPQKKVFGNIRAGEFRPAPLEVLDHISINFDPETPVSTLKHLFRGSQSDLRFCKKELRKAEEKLQRAFVEFHQKLLLLKSYRFLNMLAFSKIMKKYDKITSRNASKAYLEMVDNSFLGSSDEISRLIERVETTFIKHFANGNHSEGTKILRPKAKKEKHRVTFFVGLFFGCSIALVVAIIVSIYARNLLYSVGTGKYMDNIFPLYSLFGFMVLHMLMYSGDIYFWRRFRVNYQFIFGIKQGTEIGYRQVLLLATGLSVLTLAAVLSNLDMDLSPETESTFSSKSELVPIILLAVVLLIILCPFNVIYRSTRFFLIRCIWHCLCAPLYKVTLPDFFLADQLTSQVQALRSFQFYICYYGWGDFKRRSNNCSSSELYRIIYIIIAVLPSWSRLLQCLRRWFEEKDSMQGLNALRYFSTIAAAVIRTVYDYRRGFSWKMAAAVSSGLTTITNTYWDLVFDWGLLQRNSKNPWLRDRLLVPNTAVYFLAMVLNVFLRLAWMQLVLDFDGAPFLHKNAVVAVIACLEIIRRGIWNFFRLENEHLNNVGKFRASKSVPLPFHYNQDHVA